MSEKKKRQWDVELQTNKQKQKNQKKKNNNPKPNPLPLRINMLLIGEQTVRLHRQCERGMIRTKTICSFITQI